MQRGVIGITHASLLYIEKRCVYLDLVFNRLLGWEGGSSCVCVLGEGVHTGPSSAPQQGILIEYDISHEKSILFNLNTFNAKSQKRVQIAE